MAEYFAPEYLILIVEQTKKMRVLIAETTLQVAFLFMGYNDCTETT